VFKTEPYHVNVTFSVVNLTNKVALYNFLSTFSGTHFVTPRSYQASLGVSF
jgi:outer membrane receptor protein involved in Fe transport